MTQVNDYQNWIGKQQNQSDIADINKVKALAATLNADLNIKQGDQLPPLWHWILFNSANKSFELGQDGHALKGQFLPPISLPRRMWAGGRFEFIEPINVGDRLSRQSTISDINIKQGKTGQLAFVTVTHEIRGTQQGHWIEEHDIVYREAPKKSWRPPTAPCIDNEIGDWSAQIIPEPVVLFRYSALTFNGHRIHYDRDYCSEIEGYPGLVFHGPLTATLLIELIRKQLPKITIKKFNYKAIRPLFDLSPFSIHGRVEGKRILLWATDPFKQRAMEAEAYF